MAVGIGGKSLVWMPLAGTIVWGLGIATFLILLVMPPLYLAAEDLRKLLRRGVAKKFPFEHSRGGESKVPLKSAG
jgi:hypothetical protein